MDLSILVKISILDTSC